MAWKQAFLVWKEVNKVAEMVEKKLGFFRRLQASKKKQVIFFVVSMLVITITYCTLDVLFFQKRDLGNMVTDDFSFMFQIENIKEEDNEVILEGWMFNIDSDSKKDDMDVLLYDQERNKIIYLVNEPITRKDVNEFFEGEYDYTYSGFVAKYNTNELDIYGKDYEILISDKVDYKIYHTGTYLHKGEIVYTNPNEFIPLDVIGTDLEEIVNDGVLQVYAPENGMYVYQYKDVLYWIADEAHSFINNERTYIDCMVSTTQKNLLPEYRVSRGYDDDNLDFIFQDKEITSGNYGDYRVAVVSLSSEYVATSILTGHRADGNWVWKDNFRVYYEELKYDRAE